MRYVISYEVCSLVFLFVILVNYFSRRRFPCQNNRLYAVIMVLAVFDIIFDLTGSLCADGRLYAPLWTQYVINWLFYAMQIMIPAMLVLYVLSMMGELKKKNLALLTIFMLPAIVLEVSLCTNIYSDIYFSIDAINGFKHGSWFYTIYGGSGLYMLITLVILNIKRKKLRRRQYTTMTLFITLSITGVLLQFLFPMYLLTGMVIALSITMMYFAIENPSDMLDPLTGAFNREALARYATDLLDSKRRFCILAADIDGMHNINSLFGMEVGNAALKEVATFFARNTARKSWVFRLMGDRFAVVCSGGEADMERLAAAIAMKKQEGWSIPGVEAEINLTICAMDNAEKLGSTQNVLVAIEEMLLKAKDGSRGGLLRAGSKALVTIERRAVVERALKKAINECALSLWLQPIYSLKSGRITGAESLCRIIDPVLGVIQPNEFIPIAEKNGLIARLDNMIFEKTCEFMRDTAASTALEIVEINLSAVDLMKADLSETLTALANKFGIAPNMIGLEVTESIAAESQERMMENLLKLKEKGFGIILDDFGSGYANVSRISHLPLNSVKLDKSMLLQYSESEQSKIVFEATIKMCQRLGFHTVVEGVETKEQLDMVMTLGADMVQGFYYSRPMPAQDFAGFLQSE